MKLSKKQDLGYQVAYITHDDDKRITDGLNQSNPTITTHWSCFQQANVLFDCFVTGDLTQIEDKLRDYHVIGIDEFQFFDRSNVDVVERWVNDNKKIVYSVGLDTNFKGLPFGHINELSFFADKYKKITAKCELCRLNKRYNSKAIFSAKYEGDLTKEKETGGKTMYLPLCRQHHQHYRRNILV